LSQTPTPLLKAFAALTRGALWLLALGWITVGLFWGGLHFLIVPRIGEVRPWLEQQASTTLGITVRIGDIRARSNGLIPSFELTDVRLLDSLGREALHLPAVLAALSPRSALGLGFEQLYIDGPALDVRRDKEGRLWIAGFVLPETDAKDGSASDWIFSQTELVVRHGTLRWNDELRNAPELALHDVDFVLRNRLNTHSLRIDASPPAHWGERFGLTGVFKQPLLSRSKGNWREWQGQLYTHFTQVDLEKLRPYVDMGIEVAQGSGSLRTWTQVNQAEVTSITADVALAGVSAKWSSQLDALAMDSVSGRLGAKRLEGGYEFTTESLAFTTQDGLHWPGGNVRLAWFEAVNRLPARGEFSADRLDLTAMAAIARRLPLDDKVHRAIQAVAPKGLVEQMQASWQGDVSDPERFTAKGRVNGLSVASQSLSPLTPGFQGVNLDFDMNQVGGKATASMVSGSLEFPQIFEEARIPFDQLNADLQWKVDGQRLQVKVPSLRFSNADAQGELQLTWQSGDPPQDAARIDSPLGLLDLQGTLSRGDAKRVFRYLPLVLDKEVRDYVREGVVSGSATDVKFKVKGDLDKFPYADAKQGDFRISADIKNATFAFVPGFLLPKESLPWPVLNQLSATLVIEHDTLQVKDAKGLLAATGIQIGKASGVIDKLYDAAILTVNAEAKGPLPDMLAVVSNSPLGALTGKVLSRAVATGGAEYRFKTAFPLAAPEKATVLGAVTLAGNDLWLFPEVPRLTRLRGALTFNESGFAASGVQARALGGEVRFDGGLSVGTGKGTTNLLRVQGTATSDGLRQARELGFASRLAAYANGSSSYTVNVGLRSGVPEIAIVTSFNGMALNLPAPFSKSADSTLATRLETTVLKGPAVGGVAVQDQWQLDVGRWASATYQRDISGVEPRVLRGAIAVGLTGDEQAPMPTSGVVANINAPQVDLDAWDKVVTEVSGTDVSGSGSTGMAYMPSSMAFRSKELMAGGRKLNNVVVGGARDGQIWRANLDATELGGYVEYRQSSGPNAGRLYARLARLSIAQSAAQDVENLLDEQPTSIPALDVVVEDFELRSKKLGRLEIEAVNLAAVGAPRDVAREWRLNHFNIITPEAVFTAGGNWATVATPASTGTTRSVRERRRTSLNFKLDIADAGNLLQRFGMVGVVSKGKGRIEGQVGWMGSPITLDYPSMGGSFYVNVETGQFLKADPGIAKLLGVLSLQSLPRRLVLDFRDVFSEGFSFDFVRGDVTIEHGIARTNNLQMKGVNAAVLMEGQADIARETQLLKVVVVPEINAGSASLIASAINPLVGLTTFLAQVILRRPLIEAATQEFQIDGTWVDPRVTRVSHKGAAEPVLQEQK
jgi:uncharacterized protein (TIGR02099 family)